MSISDPVQHLSQGSIVIWTDGSCLGNPGPGGWAYIIQDGTDRREAFGHEPRTTNNRMEMTAAIQALNTLGIGRKVMLYSDSQLLIKTMTLGWKRKKNHDLWSELDRLSEMHRIEWQWVRGHNGRPENEACDNLAQRAASMVDPRGLSRTSREKAG
jgi:ribonuclease HI